MMHVSAATGVAAISEARAKGLPIYGETLHQYMLHTAEDYKLPQRADLSHLPVAQIGRGPESACGTARSTARSTASPPTSCAAPCARKTHGPPHRRHHRRQLRRRAARSASCTRRWWCARGYSLRRYVDLVSTNAAKIMGLYPQERRARRRQRCRHRHPRSGTARQGAQGVTCTRRTTRPGRATTSFAWPVGDDPARQGRRGERAVPGPRRRRPIPQAQDPGRDHPRAHAVSAGIPDRVHELLAQSLLAWRVAGKVQP